MFSASPNFRSWLKADSPTASVPREEPGVSANPDGEQCYRSSIRYYTSLPLAPREIHDRGLAELERIHAAMREIGERSFGTTDVRTLLQTVRSDARYTFSSPQEVIDYAQAGVPPPTRPALLTVW